MMILILEPIDGDMHPDSFNVPTAELLFSHYSYSTDSAPEIQRG